LSETTKIGSDLRQRLVSKFPLPAAGGGTLIGGVAFDTTESKRLEIQLYQAQKLEAIGLLAGGVAHDFNNLLTIILGYADVGKSAVQNSETLLRSLDEIQSAALRAAALTRQLLAFGRKQVIQPRMISVNVELTENHRMLRRIIREDIALNLALAPDIGVVKSDPVQIQQILLNLAMNAQDAMPDGGTVTIETANVDLDASYALSHRDVEPGPYVQLAVSDTGTGMDAETLAHVFEPFFTTKSPGKGTGLGLATVYGIVKQSGGQILVYSEPCKGTSFKIYLPRIEGAEMSRAGEIPLSEPRHEEKPAETLLIVEDEDALRSLMVKACRDAGYHVLEAHGGEEAMALIASHPERIDLLLTDVIMPGISGRTLADQLGKGRPETRILFCSGYAENAVVHHGVLAPDVEFLQKPFTPAVLLHRIRSLLAES
jgi:signal transduction histidine kinase/CheY-like chemotaxis protein